MSTHPIQCHVAGGGGGGGGGGAAAAAAAAFARFSDPCCALYIILCPRLQAMKAMKAMKAGSLVSPFSGEVLSECGSQQCLVNKRWHRQRKCREGKHRSSRSCAPGDEGDEVSSFGPRMRTMHAGEFRLVAGSLGPSSKLPEGLCLYGEKSALSGSCDVRGFSALCTSQQHEARRFRASLLRRSSTSRAVAGCNFQP